MRRMGDLMRDLGFKEDGSESTMRAFIENLVRAAENSRHKGPALPGETVAPKIEIEDSPKPTVREEQLEFDFEALMKRSIDRAV